MTRLIVELIVATSLILASWYFAPEIYALRLAAAIAH